MSDDKIDLSKSGVSFEVQKQILSDIDLYCQKTYDDGHRSHLGASLIGNDCSRYLWYVFRWVYHFEFDGRMQRLFNRGHKEEERFIEWLRGIGCKVTDLDLENNKLLLHDGTGDYICVSNEEAEKLIGGPEILDIVSSESHIAMAKANGIKIPQIRISGVNGHFGGSLDGEGYLPESYGIAEKVLFEFKTNGTGAGFNKLFDSGMQMAKEQHYAQTCVYGFKKKLDWVLYLNICKNDDNIYCELVPLNHKLGEQLELKAEKIIMSQEPPPKISESKAYFKCKYCNMKDVCHNNKPAEKNCRSCKNAVPVENGEWQCTKFNGVIPKDFIRQGCDDWDSII